MLEKMKIISYNLNGIRAAVNKGFTDWLAEEKPDVLCLQETKAHKEQLDLSLFENLGYKTYWFSAQKKGYSSVAVFSLKEPDNVVAGIGKEVFDDEGRILRVDFGDTSIFSIYFPSGSAGDIRQEIKMKFLEEFNDYISNFKKERHNIVVCGDFNICHKAIDIHNPQRNKNTSGFLPEEREWFDRFTEGGFVDTFRMFNQEPHNYSWWSYRAKARDKNLGWRIDYNMVSEELKSKVTNAGILPEVKHSDHCPVFVEIDL